MIDNEKEAEKLKLDNITIHEDDMVPNSPPEQIKEEENKNETQEKEE